MKTTLLAIAVSAAAGTPGIALTVYSSSYDVDPASDGTFEIVSDISRDAIFWCGAASHAATALSKSNSEKIYVWRGRLAKPDGSAVRFGFAPPSGGEVSGYSASVEIVGNALSVVQARQHRLRQEYP